MIPSPAAAVALAVSAVQAIEAAAVAFLSLCRPAQSPSASCPSHQLTFTAETVPPALP